MHRLSCLILLTACATPGANAPAPNDYATRNASVAGMIAMQGPGSDRCDGLSVVAKSGETRLGVATVRQSRERCSYQIDSLPSDVDITLEIQPPPGWACDAGAELQFSPSPAAQPVKLKDHQMHTRDFRAQCARKSG